MRRTVKYRYYLVLLVGCDLIMSKLNPNLFGEGEVSLNQRAFQLGLTSIKLTKIKSAWTFYNLNSFLDTDYMAITQRFHECFKLRLLEKNICRPKNGLKLIRQIDGGLLLFSTTRIIKELEFKVFSNLVYFDFSDKWDLIKVTTENLLGIISYIVDFDFEVALENQTFQTNINGIEVFLTATSSGFNIIAPRSYSVSIFEFTRAVISNNDFQLRSEPKNYQSLI